MKLQVSIAGYSGLPITLFGVIDDDTGVLVVAKQAQSFMEEKAAPDLALVSNLDLDDCDFKFSEDDLRSAIRDYFNGRSQGVIDLVDAVGRYDPHNRIERQGMDANGPKYAVSPDVDNGQIGVLALTCYWKRQQDIGSAMRAASELSEYAIQTI